MKYTLLYLSLFLFTNVSIASDFSESNPIPSKAELVIVDSEVNKILDTCVNQLNHIAHILEYLAILVYNEGHKFKHLEQIKQYLQVSRELINDIKSNSFIVPDIQTIIKLKEINQALCASLKAGLNNGSWTPIDLGLILKRDMPSDLSFEAINNDLALNQRTIDLLENSVDRFGLTATQKIVRSLEDSYQKTKFYIQDHKLENTLKYSAFSAAILTYLLYICPDKYFNQADPDNSFKAKYLNKAWNNPFTRAIKKIIGSRPQFNLEQASEDSEAGLIMRNNLGLLERMQELFFNPNYNCSVTNLDQLGLVGNFEKNFSQSTGTELSPQVLIPGVIGGYLTNQAINESRLTNYGLFLSSKPTVRMMAITNQLLNVIKDEPYQKFKYKTIQKIKRYYQKLRGQSSRNSLSQRPLTNFSDVIGLEYAKAEFEPIIEYIINPDKFERSKLVPNKGYLMIGAPRTGKSFIAKAICGEINERQRLLGKPVGVNFVNLDADTMMQYPLDQIMAHIKANAPCIVFIDEIDLLCLNRGNGDKPNMLLSFMLTNMSGQVDTIDNGDADHINKQVIFLAATNNPQNLDSALMQSGRFGKIIAFNYPTLAERINFMENELTKRSINNISSDFIAQVCAQLEGHSFEDLALIITGAIQKASSAYMPIQEIHLHETIQQNIKGIMPQINCLSKQEIQTISSYQAGKALAIKLLKTEHNISTVTTLPISKKIETKKENTTIVKPTIEQGGIFTYKNTSLLNLKSHQDLTKECQILLAGHIAQELILGESCYDYRAQDQQLASQLAKQIALEGENYSELTPELQEAVIKKAYLIKKNCKEQVRSLLSNNLDQLTKINQALQTKTSLEEDELNSLLAN